MPIGIYKRTDEHKKKISEAHKGKKQSQETIKKRSDSLKGHIVSEETRKKIGLANKGKSHKHSEETKLKISISQKGEKNHLWKGDKVSYKVLHKWVRRHKPKPELCEECKVNLPEEISNISGNYLRDLKDYRWLCIKCHRKKDTEKRIIENRMNPIRDKFGKFVKW